MDDKIQTIRAFHRKNFRVKQRKGEVDHWTDELSEQLLPTAPTKEATQ